MKTVEKIDGILVDIDWSFDDVIEMHDSGWADWSVTGEGSDGKSYQASCGADRNHPEDSHDNVTDIEEC